MVPVCNGLRVSTAVWGTGAELNVDASSLSEGTHLITITATDSLGFTNNQQPRSMSCARDRRN